MFVGGKNIEVRVFFHLYDGAHDCDGSICEIEPDSNLSLLNYAKFILLKDVDKEHYVFVESGAGHSDHTYDSIFDYFIKKNNLKKDEYEIVARWKIINHCVHESMSNDILNKVSDVYGFDVVQYSR